MDAELEEKKQWSLIRKEIDQTYKYDENWEKAIALFDTRLKRKFFDPIQTIIERRMLKGEGFTIVTIQCALIEMLSAFKQGKIFNHKKTNSSPSYEYNKSEKMFTSFLRSASIFQNNFWKYNENGKISIDVPYNSSEFYKNVRCGLMHEARTKGEWYITATTNTKLIESQKQFIISEKGKLKIHRDILHCKLLEYLSNYKEELRRDNITSETLRKFFARKLDHLFDYQPDENYGWWVVDK